MTEPARFRAGVGYTRNMGNFETLRLDFQVEDSQRSTEKFDELVERVYEKVSTILTTKLQELEDELKAAAKGKK